MGKALFWIKSLKVTRTYLHNKKSGKMNKNLIYAHVLSMNIQMSSGCHYSLTSLNNCLIEAVKNDNSWLNKFVYLRFRQMLQIQIYYTYVSKHINRFLIWCWRIFPTMSHRQHPKWNNRLCPAGFEPILLSSRLTVKFLRHQIS